MQKSYLELQRFRANYLHSTVQFLIRITFLISICVFCLKSFSHRSGLNSLLVTNSYNLCKSWKTPKSSFQMKLTALPLALLPTEEPWTRFRCTDCFFPTVLYRKQLLPMSIPLRSESDPVSLLKASREEKVNRYKHTYGWYSLGKTWISRQLEDAKTTP